MLTFSMSSELSTAFAELLRCSQTLFVAASIPLFTSIGLIPAATALLPSLKMARAKIVAVVVPSPATSFVLSETTEVVEL